ncbi:MAG: hypothetical protein QXK49_03140, partial [Candidatus Aenigmatarchaeota archaeon]
IALAALAYTWFSGIFASLTGTAGTAVTQTTSSMVTQFKIESAKYTGSATWGVNATIRNTGTQSFNASKSSAYINGVYSYFQGATPQIVTPGNLGTIYNITNISAVCGAILTITIETGLSDSRAISC